MFANSVPTSLWITTYSDYRLFFQAKRCSVQKSSWCSEQLGHLRASLRQPSAAQYPQKCVRCPQHVTQDIKCVTQDIKKLCHQSLRFNKINKMCSFIKTILMWGWLSPHYCKRRGWWARRGVASAHGGGERGDGQRGLEWPPWLCSAGSSIPTIATALNPVKKGNNLSVLVGKQSWPCGLPERVSGTLRARPRSHSEDCSLGLLARCLVHGSYFSIWLLNTCLTETWV